MPSPSWSLERPDGAEIGVHALGNGSPIVLVHGTACDHRVWARVSRRLAADRTVHAVDRRGRGASSDGPDWSLARDAEDIAALVDELDGPVPVVGHSLGAIVAIEAARLTEHVGPLVAYEPPLHGDEAPPMAAADRLEHVLEEEGPEAAVEAFLGEVGYTENQLDRLRKHEQLWQATVETAPTIPREVRADLGYEIDPDRLADVDQRVLLLEGAASGATFAAGLDRLAGALPHVERDTIDEATHAVLYEAPSRLADRIETFLAET